MSSLAFLGGEKTIQQEIKPEIFEWPIVNEQMEKTIVRVLREKKMSGLDITRDFEKKFAEWNGVKYGLGCNTGTASLLCAMYAVGLSAGDELICPANTFWASCTQAYSLRATIRFVDLDPKTLCADPDDIERKINKRTKAILVVHTHAMPADMDRIMQIAGKYDIKVIEDCSHAHYSLYKGKPVGSFGNVAGFSIMTGKSFACGEGGVMITNDRHAYERAVMFGHHLRQETEITEKYFKENSGLPWGGCKCRMNQFTSALGLVQLEKFPKEMEEINSAMNYLSDCLEDVPSVKSIRPEKSSGSTKGAWYSPKFRYSPKKLGGLSVSTFCKALVAEGALGAYPGGYRPLHLHPLFQTVDVYGEGRPTRISCLPADEDIREKKGDLPNAENINSEIMNIRRFTKFDRKTIDLYVQAIRKVTENYAELLPHDKGNPPEMGNWTASFAG